MDPFLARIKLLLPRGFDAHFKAIEDAIRTGDLTRPRRLMSDMELARAISEFTAVVPNEASIATLERRFNGRN